MPNNISMDIVITYIDGLDPLWQKEYEEYTNIPILEKRFRDWGTLRYLFRGIEVNMPFIRKVHLVVARESQVPAWIDRNEVHIVLHKDIIPAEHLPTFNSNTIEMHLHRIEDLDEEFIYFNDDIFPVKPCQPTDFFREGKGVIGMSRHLLSTDMFKRICRNSDSVARKALGMKSSWVFLRPQHICAPMLKSENERLYAQMKSEILASLTRVRTSTNLTQYMYTDYLYLQGKIIPERLSKQHFSVGITSTERMRRFIEQPTRKLVCINDVKLSKERYLSLRAALHEAFEARFPQKSRFEA